MKFKKKLMMKTMGILFASSLIATPIIACSTSGNSQSSNNDNTNKRPTNPGGNGSTGGTGSGGGDSTGKDDSNSSETGNGGQGESGGNSSSEGGSSNGGGAQTTPSVPSVVDNSIQDASNFGNVQFTNDSSNTAGVTQNISDFITNGDFKKFVGTKDELNKDVLVFFYNLSKQYKNLNINSSSIENLSTKLLKQKTEEDTKNNQPTEGDQVNKDLFLNNTSVSFKMTATIKSSIDQKITIAGKEVNLEKEKANIVTITVENQIIKPTIASYQNGNYLSWKVDDAKFALNNETWEAKNYSFNDGQPSHAFKYKFNNLTSGYTYFDLKNAHESEAYSISNEDLESEITKQIDSTMQTNIRYADYATSILGILKEDAPIDSLIKKLSPTIINILIDNKIVPEDLRGFLMDALYGKSGDDSQIKDVPLVQTVQGYEHELAIFISSLVHIDDVDTIEGILGILPSVGSSQDLLPFIQGFLDKFQLTKEQQNVVLNDILGVNGHPKSLINILFDNYKMIFTLVKQFGISNPTIDSIEKLLEIVLSKNKENQNYQSIYDSVFGSKENKQKFYDAIKGFVNVTPEIDKIVQMLAIDNDSLNKDNLMKVVTSLYNFMNGFFELNSSYTDISNKYTNLNFTKQVVVQPSIKKEDKTITFDYKYTFSLKKSAVLDLTSLKNLISDASFENLINYLVEQGDTGLTSTIKTALKGIGYGELKKALFTLIPDKLVFGENAEMNKLTFDFSAKDGKTWFDVLSQNDGKYTSGFSFDYNMNIKYDDPNFVDSITKNFDKSKQKLLSAFLLADLYGAFSDFWRSIIQNVIFRDYDVSLKMSVNTNKEIATIENYNVNQIYQNYNFKNYVDLAGNGDFIVDNVPTTETANYKDVRSDLVKDKKYSWKNDTNSEEIIGKKPIFSQEQFNKIKDRMFTFNKNFTDYGLRLTPIFNMEIPLNLNVSVFLLFTSIDYNVNVNLKTMVTNVDLYFPFRVLDTVTNKPVDHVSKTITYFKMTTETVKG